MASQGPNSPDVAANEDTGSGEFETGWTDPDNAKVSDNVYATFSTSALALPNWSQYLKLNKYAFTIPSGATIDGIEVVIHRKATNA